MINTDRMTLETAIVAQACEDYRWAIRREGKKAKAMLKEVKSFFNSEYCRLLTKIDPDYLIEKLDKEWSNGKKLIEAGNKIECPELKKNYKYVCPLCGGKAKVKETVNKKGTHFRNYCCNNCKISEKRLFGEKNNDD